MSRKTKSSYLVRVSKSWDAEKFAKFYYVTKATFMQDNDLMHANMKVGFMNMVVDTMKRFPEDYHVQASGCDLLVLMVSEMFKESTVEAASSIGSIKMSLKEAQRIKEVLIAAKTKFNNNSDRQKCIDLTMDLLKFYVPDQPLKQIMNHLQLIEDTSLKALAMFLEHQHTLK